MTLMTQLRERAADETAERDIELAREMQADEERVGRAALAAVQRVVRDTWRVPGPPHERLSATPTAAAYFEHLGIVPEVSVERRDPGPTGYAPPLRVIVELEDVTFVVTEDRTDGWELPKVRMGRLCLTCGTVVAVGGRDLRPHVAVRVLADVPMVEHPAGQTIDGRAEVCDGTEVRLAEPPQPPRADVLAELSVPSDTALAELAADGWAVHRWIGVNPGTPASVVVVLRDERASVEEPF